RIVEGLLDQYIFSSIHEPLFLILSLLNDDDAIDIGKIMNLFDNEYICLHSYFRISISDIDGYVKILEYYYTYFSEKLESNMMTEKEIAVYNVNIEKIMKDIKCRIFSSSKDDVVDLNKRSITYQKLSLMRVINLILIEQTEEYLIQLLYVWDVNFSLSFLDVEVDLPQEDIKLYKLLHQYPITKTYENNQVKYANITEVRKGYISLDLLKNINIKSYIGCVFINTFGTPFDAFGFLNKNSEFADEICVA
ncbi:2809_t:CDS:2, partial [Funneliformis caledonium]